MSITHKLLHQRKHATVTLLKVEQTLCTNTGTTTCLSLVAPIVL